MARLAGIDGGATCALLACKLNEVETHARTTERAASDPKMASSAEYDPSYAEIEKQILTEVGYCTISHTCALARRRMTPEERSAHSWLRLRSQLLDFPETVGAKEI